MESGVQDLSWTSQTKVWTPENQLNQFENLAHNGVRSPRFILDESGVQSWTSQTKVWTPENQLNQFDNLAPKNKP
jgi:hypothetical protein